MRPSTRRPAHSAANVAAAGIAALAGVAALGCAPRTPHRPPLHTVERVVVAPLNLAVRLPTELEDGVDTVEDEMIRYLQRRDSRVSVIWPSDAWDLWRESMASVESSGRKRRRLETAAGRFVRELTHHADFGLFILPSLVYRQARVTGRTAKWDGVRRRVKVRTQRAPEAALPGVENEAGVKNSLGGPGDRGRMPAVSLHVLVFTPDGVKVYEGSGGLDLVHDALMGSGSRAVVPRKEIFTTPEHIQEGIALALDPYVVVGQE